MQNNKSSRNDAIDLFRFFAALMVVAIHANPFYDINNVLGFLVCQVLVRVAVPFFFIISGYYFFKGLAQNGMSYAVKYIKKLLIYYSICSIVYYIIDFFQLPNNSSILSFFKSRIVNFVIFGSHYHLWFYPALIVSIVIITLAHKLKIEKVLFIATVLFYVIGCFSTTYISIMPKPLNIIFNTSYFEIIRRIFLMGLPFCMLGYFLSFITKDKKYDYSKSLIVSIIAYCIETALIVALKSKAIILTFSLYPLVAFIVLNLLNVKKQLYFRAVFRDSSMFIYLFHPIIIKSLEILFIEIDFSCGGTLIWFLTCIISFALSIVIYLLKHLIKNSKIKETLKKENSV